MRLKTLYTQKIRSTLNVLSVIASIILITSISLEAFGDNPFAGRTAYIKIQLFVCLYFIIDFIVLCFLAERRWQFFRRYFFMLLIAIPYLSLIPDAHLHLSKEQLYS